MDLLSVAAPCVEISIGIKADETVSVRGLSLRDIASLLMRFPDLLTVFNGRELNVESLILSAPSAAAAIMAAGAGYASDAKAEAVCATLGLQYQVNMLIKIVELTFPAGIGPFVEAMERLSVSLPGPKANGAAPDHETPATS
jgi:hypothetical protein